MDQPAESKSWLTRTLSSMTYGFRHPLWLLGMETLENEAVQHTPYLWPKIKIFLGHDPLPEEDPPPASRKIPGFRDIFRTDSLPMDAPPKRGAAGPLVDLFRTETLPMDAPPKRSVAGPLVDLFRTETLPMDAPPKRSVAGPLVDLFRPESLPVEADPNQGKALRFLGGLLVPEKLPRDGDC